jgi:hypothetical protein
MRFLTLAVAFALWFTPVSAVYYGQSRVELIQELGKPSSELKRGAREVLIYKNGRIELENGRVAIVQGIAVAEGPGVAPPATEKPAEAEPSEEKVETPAPAVVATDSPSVAQAPTKSAEQQMQEADAAARAKFEKEIEALESPKTAHEEFGAGPPRWLTFVVELAIKAIMMLAALWLTTKYWSVEISWFGLAMAAIADTITRAAVGAVALWALQMGTTMYADEATAAIVLVVVLRKVSYNQSLSQAVTITLTSKTFSIVVGSFLSVFLMHTLFGGGGGLMPF